MDASGYVFEEFDWNEREPDVRRERLCAGGSRPPCDIEGATFATAETGPKDEITVVAYNVQRGIHLDEQIERLAAVDGLPEPDILLLSEVDRGCSRSGWHNIAREYARALRMYYVYAVEFVELPRFWGPDGAIRRACEHGNAIVSRYPLGNVRAIRHSAFRRWDSRCQRLLRIGEPRYGSRVALAADVRIGARYVHIYAVHFESGDRFADVRTAQVVEAADDALNRPFGAIIAGDMNAGRYIDDLRNGTTDEPATKALLDRGFADAHAALDPDERLTTDSGAVIDLIFGRGVEFTAAGVAERDYWARLSDHLPVWSAVRLP